jgi:lysophospholipid acyltransferase (LPLAT)-like uncharacterized protein
MSAKRKTRLEICGDRKSRLLGKLLGWAMKLTTATLRVDLRNPGRIGDPSTPVPPMILMLWHSRFFVVPSVWHKMLRTKRQVSILTSASRDGDMVANAMAVFGFEAIRGSSSRRAVAALVGLKRALEDGQDVCLTPDGPRGPRYKVQAGAIKLAEATGAPIVPVHVRFSSAWRLGTWDRFVIPCPFSRVTVTFGEPLHVQKGLDAEAMENERLKIESLLLSGTDDA